MFTLYEIVQNAQDGQAVDNLARRFDISPEQADAAVQALMPAISAAFMKRTAEPAAFGSILGAIGDEHHAMAFADLGAAQADLTVEKGAEAAQHLFGSTETNAAVAQHAAGIAGLPPALIQQMMPVIVSMLMGGLGKSLANQGLGGIFGQLAGAAGQGGLGSILGGLLGGAGAAQAQPNGQSAAGAGGLGSILGGLLGGAAPAPAQQHPGARPQPGAPPQGGLGGLAAILGGLLGGAAPAQGQPRPGAPAGSPGETADAPAGGVLGQILGSLLGGNAGATQQQGRPAEPQGQTGLDSTAVQQSLEALIKMMQPGTPQRGSQRTALQGEIDSILDGKRT